MRPALVFPITLLLAGRAAAGDEPWYPVSADCVTTAASDDARRALAAYWFEQGTAQVDAEAFADAMRSYGCSQRIIPHHNTLYNLARAAEWAGEYDVALRALREYIETAPDDEKRAEAEELIVRVSAAAAADADAANPPPEPEPAEPPPADRGTDLQEGLGWAAVGLAGVAGALGAVLGGLAAYEHAEIEDAPDGTPWTEIASREDRRDTFLLAMGASLGAAAAFAVAGTLLLVLDTDDEAPAVELAPTAAPDAAGMVLTWKF